jgi:hypothetical protein
VGVSDARACRAVLVRFLKVTGWCGLADGCAWLGRRISIGELQCLFWLRDFGHGGLGEEAAPLQLPILLLLQQLTANQPHDRGVIGEDADHVGAAFDHCAAKRASRCDVEALKRGLVLQILRQCSWGTRRKARRRPAGIFSLSEESLPRLSAWGEVGGISPCLCFKAPPLQTISI